VNFDLKNKVLFGIVVFLALSLVLVLANPANAEIESPKKQMKRGVAPEEWISNLCQIYNCSKVRKNGTGSNNN